MFTDNINMFSNFCGSEYSHCRLLGGDTMYYSRRIPKFLRNSWKSLICCLNGKKHLSNDKTDTFSRDHTSKCGL